VSFLLKIVEGSNKGAEIALVEGVAVTLGKGDDCDIVLADPTMPETPLAIEATSSGVMVGGEPLEALHVRTVGATSFAVGPADAPWGELVWPKSGGDADASKDAEETRADEAKKPAEGKVEGGDGAPGDSEPQSEEKRHRGCCGCIVVAFLLLMILAALAWFFRDRLNESGRLDQLSETARSWYSMLPWKSGSSAQLALPKTVDLSDIAAKYSLSYERSDSGAKISGNLKTRRERLAATAEAYAVQPGVDLDITDDESLHTAAEDALFSLTEGALKVSAATNRTVVVVGHARSAGSLKRILEALNADIPKLRGVDVAGVVFSHTAAEPRSVGDGVREAGSPAIPRAARTTRRDTLSLPVCGILTTPYPCLISRDGRRYLEGAEIGGSTIVRIDADSVVLTNSTGRFTWKP